MRLPNIVLELMNDIENVTDQDLAKAERQLEATSSSEEPTDYVCEDTSIRALFALTNRYQSMSLKRFAEAKDADSAEEEKDLLIAARHYHDMFDAASELWWAQIGDEVQQDNPQMSLGVRQGWKIVKRSPKQALRGLLGGLTGGAE